MKRLGSAASLHGDKLPELIGFAVIFVTIAYRRTRPRATT
jgi:hypothetical protein